MFWSKSRRGTGHTGVPAFRIQGRTRPPVIYAPDTSSGKRDGSSTGLCRWRPHCLYTALPFINRAYVQRTSTTTDGRHRSTRRRWCEQQASWPRPGLPVVDLGWSQVADCRTDTTTQSTGEWSTFAVNNTMNVWHIGLHTTLKAY